MGLDDQKMQCHFYFEGSLGSALMAIRQQRASMCRPPGPHMPLWSSAFLGTAVSPETAGMTQLTGTGQTAGIRTGWLSEFLGR